MTSSPLRALIEFQNVAMGYGNRPVLTGVSFAIQKGEFLGIVGPNGSGKTTLLRTLLGIVPPMSGRIHFPSETPPVIGYVPQRDAMDLLLPFTAAEVVLMGRYHRIGLARRPKHADWNVVKRSLQQVGMDAFEDTQFRDLSGGQKQRTLIARALASQPELLILDEPTNGMDIAARHSILELIRSLHAASGLSVVMVSHMLGDVANCVQRIALITDGNFTVGATESMLKESTLSQLYDVPIAVGTFNGRTIISVGGLDARN